MRGRRLARLLAISGVIVCLAAACGDDDSAAPSDDNTSTDAADDSGAEPTATEPAADDAADTSDDSTVEDCSGGGATDVGVTADAIKIVMITAQTGGNSGGSANFHYGAEAYLERLNEEQGGVCGREIQWELLDDESDSARQAELMRDAIDGGAFAIFLGSGQYTDPEYPCSSGIPVVGTAFAVGWYFCDSNFGTNAGSWKARNINDLPTTPSALSAQDAFIMAETGATTMVTLGYSIASSANAALNTCDNFNDTVKPDGMTCAFSDGTVEFGFSSAGATTTRIIDSGATHFYAGMDIVGCVTYVDAIRTAGLSEFTFRCAVGIDDANIAQFGESLEPIVITATTPNFTSDHPAMVDFVEGLTFWKPGVTPGDEALNGWNSAKFFHRVLEQLGADVTQAGFVDAVRNGTSDVATAWDADGLMVPVDFTENRWDAIEAGTYTPASGCIGTFYHVDFDAGAWVPMEPDPLCLSGMDGNDAIAYAAATDSGFD